MNERLTLPEAISEARRLGADMDAHLPMLMRSCLLRLLMAALCLGLAIWMGLLDSPTWRWLGVASNGFAAGYIAYGAWRDWHRWAWIRGEVAGMLHFMLQLYSQEPRRPADGDVWGYLSADARRLLGKP